VGEPSLISVDEHFMSRALRLAALGRHASPNPMVGCVLVGADGSVVGEGYHHRPGEPHAEVNALIQAGSRARGSTAYVTLEPCSHYGRTGPCSEALILAGVSRVCCAMTDPDPRVSGNGVMRLQEAGVAVTTGILGDAAASLNRAYIKQRTTGFPYVILKSAATLDGKTATASGDSKWISSQISRLAVHRQLRDRCDAILVGVGTVLADDPALTTRLTRRVGRDPVRIVADSLARTPLSSKIVLQSTLDGKTIIAVSEAADPGRVVSLRQAGCRIVVCEAAQDGRINLRSLLKNLGTAHDIVTVVVEGGAVLAAALFDGGLVDRWTLYLAPMIAGGDSAHGLLSGAGAGTVAEMQKAKRLSVARSGPDLRIDAYFG